MKKQRILFSIVALILTTLACDPKISLPDIDGDGNNSESTTISQDLPTGMPAVETDYDKMLETLQSGQVVVFEQFAVEQYTEEDFAGPNEVTFTSTISDSKIVFWNYGWCASDDDTLADNLSKMSITFLFNGEVIPESWIQTVGNTRENGWKCALIGLLLSNWEKGTYDFEIIVRFQEKLNDGGADFDAGDYVFKYYVTVE